MEKLTAVAIDNQIRLVKASTPITVTLLVPRGNIQRMKEKLECKILKVGVCKTTFNHNAGVTCSVTINVKFGKLEPYLRVPMNPTQCTNYEAFADLMQIKGIEGYYVYNSIIDASKVGLYTFGLPIIRQKNTPCNGIYLTKSGQKFNINNRFDKYVKFKGEWAKLIEVK